MQLLNSATVSAHNTLFPAVGMRAERNPSTATKLTTQHCGRRRATLYGLCLGFPVKSFPCLVSGPKLWTKQAVVSRPRDRVIVTGTVKQDVQDIR